MAMLSFLGVSARTFLRAASSKSVRAYGSAVAAHFDYDNEEDMEEPSGSVPRRGVQWLIMGHPMTQRHVYAQWLSKLMDVPYISMGSLVPQQLNPHYNKVFIYLLTIWPICFYWNNLWLYEDIKCCEWGKACSRRSYFWFVIKEARRRSLQRWKRVHFRWNSSYNASGCMYTSPSSLKEGLFIFLMKNWVGFSDISLCRKSLTKLWT